MSARAFAVARRLVTRSSSRSPLLVLCLLYAHIFAFVRPISTYKKLHEMGYEVEVHSVDTEDGYTLALERVPHSRSNQIVGSPILLLHGLFSNSLVFTLNRASLAYSLIDAGHDVWLYNSRGAGLSRDMTNEPLDRLSWEYSFHEMGIYDLAACVDYITNTTKKKVTVVGYSLGGTIALILLSEKPQYNEKITKSLLMAPAVRMKNPKSPLNTVRFWAPFVMELLDIFDFFPYTPNPDATLKSIRKYCENSEKALRNCRLFLNFVNGVETSMADEAVLNFLASFPQPVSSKTLKHYVQGLTMGDFRKYDYGAKANVIKYNDTEPPAYNLSRITSSIVVVGSTTDSIVTIKDIKWLVSRLRNVAEVNFIKNVRFGHISYIADPSSKELVVDYILQKLNSTEEAGIERSYRR